MATKHKSPARTFLVQTTTGEFKVDVPEGGMVTFGPAIPGPPGAGRGGAYGVSEYALRVYGPGGKTDLIAVFTGVREFRDIALPHAKAIVKEAGKTLWKSDETGYEVSTSVKRDKEYVALEGMIGTGGNK